jgi:hypothetical protein
MTSELRVGVGLPNWFRWLARGLLLMAVFAFPFFELLKIHCNYSCFGIWLSGFLFTIVIVIVAWRKPFSGGVAAAIIGVLFIGPMLSYRATTEYWKLSYGLPYLVPCLLLLIGGILSVTWGRTLPSRVQKVSNISSSDKRSWFRSLPRGFLLIAALIPLLEAITRYYPDLWKYLDIYSYIFDTSTLLIITVIAWIAPIAGGVLAILAVADDIFLFLMDFKPPSVLWDSIMWLLLAVGGILSIIWGVRQWRWKRNQAKMTA